MKSPHRTRALIAAALLGVSTVALAEDVTVKLPTATVLSGKTARSAKVAQLSQGAKLQVLGREGSWLKVKVGEKEGYVHENAVSASGGGGGGEGLGGLGKMLGSASGASSATSAEAGRGIGESEKWAQSKNMSAAGLQRMIAIRNSVSDADWQRFAGDDKGPAK
jgi:hypothetical protein